MKHQTFEFMDGVQEDGDTADLHRCLWLTNMKASTRTATAKSISAFRGASGWDGEVPVTELRRMIDAPSADLKAAMNGHWIQVASDLRRALRAWDDPSLRWLALRLRHRVPALADAATAADLRLSAGEANRARKALEALASADGGKLEDLPATRASIEPLLRAATPETFGVTSMKSLENKKTLVRKAVRLVDPLTSGGRETATTALPGVWQDALGIIESQLKDHERSQRSILRRLAAFCAKQSIAPNELNEQAIKAFVSLELAVHAATYVEKLRAAFRRWNDAVDAEQALSRLALPGAPVHRQDDVDWKLVPEGIRAPVDAFLETTVSVRNPGDWGALVPEDDPEYAELGIPAEGDFEYREDGSTRFLAAGSAKNWRDAVKRAWHAARHDPRVTPKPETLEDLFTRPVVNALVAATRSARRDRLEAQGRTFDPKRKGRYEHTLVEAMCSVGRALSIEPQRLEAVEELKRQIDPHVVGMKRTADGAFKRVYAERRIGHRHATMLAAFSDMSRLKRYFEAPSVLWSLACKPIEKGRKPQAFHVSLARSALVARIGQFVAPLRRTNVARLRHDGDDPHITLPVGDGEGTLYIPASEGKTLRSIHVRIDRETVRMLKYYIKHFLPIARKGAKASEDNPHLFPGADGAQPEDGGYLPGSGFITKEKLNSTFKKHMKKYSRLDLCLHVMRHLAGKIILDQDPSAMALVQEILGHKRIQTTQSYYAEVSKIIAQSRYIHLLEAQSRKALATIKFRFIDPKTGKEI